MFKVGLALLLVGSIFGTGNPVLADGKGARHLNKIGESGAGKGGAERGGAALGLRSQKGRENANAQWSAGATKGQERANLRRREARGHGIGKNYDSRFRGQGKGKGRSKPGQSYNPQFQ